MRNYFKDIPKFFKSNNKRLAMSHYFALPYVPAYPQNAWIELISGCNLRCPFCARVNGPDKKKGVMPYEKFCRIINEIGPHLRNLGLNIYGEAFLHKDVYRCLSYARKISKKAYIYMDTNGHTIDIEKLFLEPPDELDFSIDGFDQETYSVYRRRGKFDVAYNNLLKTIEYKKKFGLDKPKIILKFIVMKHNEHYVDRLPEITKEIGADDYRIDLFLAGNLEEAKKYMPTIKKYQRYDENKLNENVLDPYIIQLKQPCPSVFKYAYIRFNGDVMPCCIDYDGDYTFGNVFQEGSFWKVWNGAKAREFRKIQKTPDYRKKISICRTCQYDNYDFDLSRNSSLRTNYRLLK